MKKNRGFILAILLCVFSVVTTHAANLEDVSLWASNDIINNIQADISNATVESWTETSDARMNFDYVVPVYATTGATENSDTIMDTLEFTNQYNIPAVNVDGDCIGMFNVVFHDNQWTINSYRDGLDFLTAVESMPSNSVCFIEISQLGEEFGFLAMSNSEEIYKSIVHQQSVYSSESESSVLSQITNRISSENVDGEGEGNAVTNNFTSYFMIVAVAILVAIVSTIGVLKFQKTKKNE